MPAANVLAFPDTDLARGRRLIRLARSHDRLNKIGDRIRRMRHLTREERVDLACRFAGRHVEISLPEGR